MGHTQNVEVQNFHPKSLFHHRGDHTLNLEGDHILHLRRSDHRVHVDDDPSSLYDASCDDVPLDLLWFQSREFHFGTQQPM